MIPGMNQKKMAQAMKRMGISQVEIDAKEVIIRTEDKEYIFTDPQVSRVNMMGQNTYQIIGDPVEREISDAPDIIEDDITTVMEKTGATREDAMKAIEESNGDLAEAIMSLSS